MILQMINRNFKLLIFLIMVALIGMIIGYLNFKYFIGIFDKIL